MYFVCLIIYCSSIISLVEFLKDYVCIKWTGVDIASVYNISEYLPDFVKKVL